MCLRFIQTMRLSEQSSELLSRIYDWRTNDYQVTLSERLGEM